MERNQIMALVVEIWGISLERLNGNTMAKNRSKAITVRVKTDAAMDKAMEKCNSLHVIMPRVPPNQRVFTNRRTIEQGMALNVMRRSATAMLAIKRFVTDRIYGFVATIQMVIMLPLNENKNIKEQKRTVITCCIVEEADDAYNWPVEFVESKNK